VRSGSEGDFYGIYEGGVRVVVPKRLKVVLKWFPKKKKFQIPICLLNSVFLSAQSKTGNNFVMLLLSIVVAFVVVVVVVVRLSLVVIK